MRLVFASHNRNKFSEMQSLLGGRMLGCEVFGEGGIELLSLAQVRVERGLAAPPEPVENFNSYFQNAQLKADEIGEWAGMPALSDDSGLEVFALNGEPGVHSAYFAGPAGEYAANNRKLLDALAESDDRRALFRCLLCMRLEKGRYLVAEGTVEGVITREPRGLNGWGYEPLFEIPELGKTIAELRDEGAPIPNHRARAVGQLRGALASPFLSNLTEERNPR
jgi:XTP/dITP diphosphohydrolase